MEFKYNDRFKSLFDSPEEEYEDLEQDSQDYLDWIKYDQYSWSMGRDKVTIKTYGGIK